MFPTRSAIALSARRRATLRLAWLGGAATVLVGMVRLVLFDIDGTLIRTGGAGVAAFSRVAEHVYGRPGGTASLRFHGATDTGLVRDFLRTHGVVDTPQERDRFLKAYLFWLDHHLTLNSGEVCPGIHNFLGGMRQLPHQPLLGLLTGNIRLGAELKLRAHQLWDGFRVGGFGDDHEDRAEIARAARKRGVVALGQPLRDDEVLVIGDTPADVACGRAIGARCLAVATGGIDFTTLKACAPDWCVSDLRGVDAAAFCG
jgi:phosphoglycolate phosphatase-like HAD superfamily hydrolase